MTCITHLSYLFLLSPLSSFISLPPSFSHVCLVFLSFFFFSFFLSFFSLSFYLARSNSRSRIRCLRLPASLSPSVSPFLYLFLSPSLSSSFYLPSMLSLEFFCLPLFFPLSFCLSLLPISFPFPSLPLLISSSLTSCLTLSLFSLPRPFSPFPSTPLYSSFSALPIYLSLVFHHPLLIYLLSVRFPPPCLSTTCLSLPPYPRPLSLLFNLSSLPPLFFSLILSLSSLSLPYPPLPHVLALPISIFLLPSPILFSLFVLSSLIPFCFRRLFSLFLSLLIHVFEPFLCWTCLRIYMNIFTFLDTKGDGNKKSSAWKSMISFPYMTHSVL